MNSHVVIYFQCVASHDNSFFVVISGDADVPNAYVDNPKLSEWVNKQRSVSVCLLC